MKYNIINCVLLFLFPAFLSAQTPGTLKWEFKTPQSDNLAPAIGLDGTIYLVNKEWSKSGVLYAINPDGTQKWKFYAYGEYNTYSPTIGKDGTIYICDIDDWEYPRFIAVNPDGTKKWELKEKGSFGIPAIDINGGIYMGAYVRKFCAFYPDGTLKWEFETTDSVEDCSPAIANDGTIYFCTTDNKFYALNSDGTKKWEFLIPDGFLWSSPAIGVDGTIYIGSVNNNLYAISPNGTIKWTFLTGDMITSSPAIGSDGTIYVGSNDKNIYAINPNGTKKWEFLTDGKVYSSPAIGRDGTIYIGKYAINPNGTKKWEFSGASTTRAISVGNDGSVYFPNYYSLLAINCSNKELADSSWPKIKQSKQNMASIEEPIIIKNSLIASFSKGGQNASVNLDFKKLNNEDILISQVKLDNNKFQLDTTLPITVNNNETKFSIPLTVLNPKIELYESNLQIIFSIDSDIDTLTKNIQLATILDDNSELSVVGERAIEAYNNSVDSNQVATLNNRGVIYRLLGYPEFAKNDFDNAISMAIEQNYGFAGIKMNQGVVQSDMDNTQDADLIYKSSVADVTDEQENSVLAPQIFYNQAWEFYVNENYEESEPLALQTLNHIKSNTWLKAKAAALLGAIKYSLGDEEAAIESFQMAYSLDMNGPIGKLAQENMGLVTSVPGISNNFGLQVYPQPATDYVVVEYKGKILKEVSIELIDLSGKIVYSKRFYPTGTDFHQSINVDKFKAGIYNLRLVSGKLEEVRKIIIQ